MSASDAAVANWPESRAERLLDCVVFDVERSHVTSPVDGSAHEFYRLQAPDWAQIVPVTHDDEIVMVRQYRHGAKNIVLEIPAGQVDPGETPADAAVRECLEETGYRARHARLLLDVNPNPALFANRLYAYFALGVEPVDAIQNTATEQTEVVLVPRADLVTVLREGGIDHALVAMTLWRFLDLDPR
jgi:8-oxo-dGTP pyrophosphatase MutT (NUDIX family)